MPPEHLEEARETGGSRVEQLASNFAVAVLMPADTPARFAVHGVAQPADP